jgi:hypothetical protein
MSDWRNTIPLIVNKIRMQLYATNYDDLEKISTLFRVALNFTSNAMLTRMAILTSTSSQISSRKSASSSQLKSSLQFTTSSIQIEMAESTSLSSFKPSE